MLLRRLALKVWKNYIVWLFFQKLGKSIDNKNVDLVNQKAQLQAFKGYINVVKVKKKRNVERTDPNKKFIIVADVIRIRKDMEPTIVVTNG